MHIIEWNLKLFPGINFICGPHLAVVFYTRPQHTSVEMSQLVLKSNTKLLGSMVHVVLTTCM